jgi:hypothetical protein
MGWFGVYICVELQILTLQTRVLGDAREHSRVDLFAIVERKDEIWPALARKCAV